MTRRRACLAATIATFALLGPLPAAAAPNPSPPLDQVLLAPPDPNFLETGPATGMFEGSFDPQQYATLEGGDRQGQVEQALVHDGFVAGYGRTWLEHGGHRAYVEAVSAFDGADGANAWLRQAEAGDKAGPTYKRALTVSGVGTYYGARLFDATNHLYVDAFAFAKGNDVFLVSTVSAQDDLADTAAAQTKRQYDVAPAYTIPPSSRPQATSAAYDFGPLVGRLTVYALAGGVVLLVIGLIVRSRRRAAVAPGTNDAGLPRAQR